MLIFVVIASYGMNYFLGVRTNRAIAAKIIVHVKDFLQQHFTQLGNGNKEGGNELGMDLDHSHQFEYYCNGNSYAYFM